MKKIISIVILAVFQTINCFGQSLFQVAIGGTSVEWAESIIQTTDGGYAVAGWTESFGAGGRDVWLIRMDSSGNELWNSTFGKSDAAEARSVKQTDDGGYIMAGYVDGGVWLIKTDYKGNKMWDKFFIGRSDYEQEGGTVQQTNDGGYIIGMNKYSSDTGGDIWLIKVAR